MKIKQNFLWAILSGILCATSYPPFPAWALFFCFVPIWTTWQKADRFKTVFLTGLLCQFVITLLGFYWVAHTVHHFGHIPFALSILVLFGFCLISNWHVTISGMLTFLIHKKWPLSPARFFVTVALLHGFFELVMPAVFPWNLGYSLLFSHFQTAQLAEFVGFNILSTLTLLINAALALSLYRYPQKKWFHPIVGALVIIILTEGTGYITVHRLKPTDKQIKVLVAQSNISNLEEYYAKYGYGYANVITDKLINQAQNLLKTEPHPDFIAWPENAFPDVLDPYSMGRPNQQKLFKLLKDNQVGLLTGGFSQDFANTRMAKEYSAIFAYDKEANLKGLYRKHILLAFGEYFPGAQYIPFLKTIVPEIGDVARGPGPQILTVGNISFSPVICYEAIHPDFVTESSNLGSHVIFNSTIDSWYGRYSEQWQHLIMSVARSVELRKPLIRSTNTGYSTITDVTGKMKVISPLFEEWGKTVEVDYYSEPPRTLYSKIHKSIPFALLSLVSLWILSHIIRHGNKRT